MPKLKVFCGFALATLFVASASFVVLAMSRDKSVVSNSLTVADTASVRLIDDSDDEFGKKEITFSNDGSTGMLLRIAYDETWMKYDGTLVSNTSSVGANVVSKDWTTEYVRDFVDGGDGWYYYSKVLNAGEAVKVLNGISLEDESYREYDYDISFRYESIQPTAGAVSELWGKTATIENGEVAWTF